MIVAKNCYFWSVFPQISCGGYRQNSSKFPKPHFLLTCTYFGGRRHGRNPPMAKATDGLAFGITRHCRIEGLPPMPPTPELKARKELRGQCGYKVRILGVTTRNYQERLLDGAQHRRHKYGISCRRCFMFNLRPVKLGESKECCTTTFFPLQRNANHGS